MSLTIQHCESPSLTWLRYEFASMHTVNSLQEARHHGVSLVPSSCLQMLHRLEVRVNRGAEGKSGKVFVGDLSEENALELAGKVISESFLWLVSPSRGCPCLQLLLHNPADSVTMVPLLGCLWSQPFALSSKCLKGTAVCPLSAKM